MRHIKCAGNKTRLVPQLLEWAPKLSTVYLEPFCGSAALFLALAEQKRILEAWLNDSNRHLIWTLRAIADQPEALITAANAHMAQHSSEYYYSVRAQHFEFEPENELAIAARFLYLNRTCFNGLYRENSSGQFNVPIGSYENPQIPTEAIRQAHVSLQRNAAMITAFDFKTFLNYLKKSLRSDCFVYFDPPYDKIQKKQSFTKYTARDFTRIQQAELAELFAELTTLGIPCMLSNADTEFIRKLYENKGYIIEQVYAPRMINSNRNGRGKVPELVIMNYP